MESKKNKLPCTNYKYSRLNQYITGEIRDVDMQEMALNYGLSTLSANMRNNNDGSASEVIGTRMSIILGNTTSSNINQGNQGIL